MYSRGNCSFKAVTSRISSFVLSVPDELCSCTRSMALAIAAAPSP